MFILFFLLNNKIKKNKITNLVITEFGKMKWFNN